MNAGNIFLLVVALLIGIMLWITLEDFKTNSHCTSYTNSAFHLVIDNSASRVIEGENYIITYDESTYTIPIEGTKIEDGSRCI